MEGVDHHGKFFGFGRAKGGFDGTGLGSVGNAEGMERDASFFDPLAGAEFVVYVVEDFVGVDIGVVVGHGDGLRVVVEKPWAEATDNEVVPIESLMDRRRHVEFASDG